MTIEVTLQQPHSTLSQETRLLLPFYPLGHQGQTEPPGQIDHALHYVAREGFTPHVAHEGAILR